MTEPIQETKYCKVCKEDRPVTEFYRYGKERKSALCIKHERERANRNVRKYKSEHEVEEKMPFDWIWDVR